MRENFKMTGKQIENSNGKGTRVKGRRKRPEKYISIKGFSQEKTAKN